MLTVSIKAGVMTITLPVAERPSSSGKSTIVASTGGFQATTTDHKGKPIQVSVNAIVK